MSSRDPAACHAAIHGLLHALPDEQRAHAATFLLGELARLYESAVPGAPDQPADADPGDVDGWLSTFVRYLGMSRLAVAGADLPQAFRSLMEDAAVRLEREGLCARLGALLAQAGHR